MKYFIIIVSTLILGGIIGIRLSKDFNQLQAQNATYLTTIAEKDSINALLSDSLQVANTLSTTKQHDLDSSFAAADILLGSNIDLYKQAKYLKGELDRISSLQTPPQIIYGSGTVKDFQPYGDAWLRIDFSNPNIVLEDSIFKATFELDYQFRFTLGEVRLSKIDENNNVRTIASVWLENSNGDRKYLSDFVLNETVIKVPESKLQVSWWNPSLHFAIVPYTPVMGGLSFSSCSYGLGTQGSDVIVYFPTITLATSGNEGTAPVGAILNLGHFLPLIHNVNFGINYDPFRRMPLLTVGTTL